MKKFRPVQNKAFCRQENICDSTGKVFCLINRPKSSGTGENYSNQHFLLFLQCFSKPTLSGSLQFGIAQVKNYFGKRRSNRLNKILTLSKLKAFADENTNVIHKLNFLSAKVENIVGKGENAGYQHFSFSNNVFKRLLSQGR